MRVISIGDLVTDYYYQNGKLLGVNGGITSHNIVANLTKWKIETSVFGVCGNDAAGLIAIKSLDDLKVDTSNIIKNEDIKTRCFHVSYIKNGDKTSFSSKKRCPICNNKKWYDKSKINTDKIIKDIKNDDILVFDNLNDKNQKIIDSVNNKRMLDLGQYFEFEDLSDKKIIDKLNNKFEIVNLNERVEKYLKKRFNIKNEVELYKKISPKLLTITKGKSGAKFIYSGIKYEFTPKHIGEEVDPTGAGDAFFSCIIKEYIKNNMIIDETKFEKWYNASVKLTSKVVEKMGARGHLHSLYKIKIKSDCCHCDTFDFVERKKIKRCNININNLEKR
ncbi:MAG: carbohydrate kinase family protein, partial [Bacilli bacterium]|nr:carbohydrate kinase family protein [Bacilli bacterium]